MEQAPADVIDYVRAAAQIAGLALDEPQLARVALHFARTRDLAGLLADLPLSEHVELAQIYCPAPFPAEEAEP
jgi:hypothetical protein